MRRALMLSTVALTTLALSARAQAGGGGGGGIKLSDVAGRWVSQSMIGPHDSVVTRGITTATADGKGWTMKFPGRDPIPLRVVATGGDSIVTEAGPYPSVLRPGETVKLLRIVGHYSGDTMTGTFDAQYASGAKLHGKTTAQRRK